MIQGFDEDENGILDSTELTNWRFATEQMFSEWNWQPSKEYMAGVKKAWQDSQLDGDDHTANQAELAQFNLRTWNLLLPH